MTTGETDDAAAIRAVIERQFAALSWTAERKADWQSFAGDFLADAMLFPSARPVASRTVSEFAGRMQQLAASSLLSLEEEVLGIRILQFGNVAVAAVGCRMVENAHTIEESAEMLLLVKSDGAWRIAGQAWDKATAANPLPPFLSSQSVVSSIPENAS